MKRLIIFAAFLLLCSCCDTSKSVKDKELPRLEKRGAVTQLIVDGEPYLVLGGELHNSSSSSVTYMQPVWSKLKSMGLNTVLAVVSWEQVEAEEGKFDFSTVDNLLRDARSNDMKLIILWFGSWKNGITSYVPMWVKRDQERFPLARSKDGVALPILSTFGAESVKADTKAYAAMMRHLKDNDAERTVIMVQIENEVGLHGDTRDYSPQAEEMFSGSVPSDLMSYLTTNKERLLPELIEAWNAAGGKTSGTWTDVFGKGDSAAEIFMAWHYSTYINQLAQAGKIEYALPTFVNAWIVQPQDNHPGDYPSGGPQAHVHDIYRAGAPSIDMLCPDIYLSDYPTIISEYSRSGNAVFVPESKADVNGAANAFYTIAQMGGIGYSPFGIEGRMSGGAKILTSTASPTESSVQADEIEPFTAAYDVLSSISPLILEHQALGTIRGAWLKATDPSLPEISYELGDYVVKFELRKTRNSTVVPAVGYGLVIMLAHDEYLVVGADIDVTFATKTGEIAALAKVQEGEFKDDKWIANRWLNGDEVQLRYDLLQSASEGQSGAGLRFIGEKPTIQRVLLYNYK